MKGGTIRFLTGTAGNIGKEVEVTSIMTVPGGTNVITFTPALGNAVANADTFKVDKGAYYIMNAGAIAAGIFKSYDPNT